MIPLAGAALENAWNTKMIKIPLAGTAKLGQLF